MIQNWLQALLLKIAEKSSKGGKEKWNSKCGKEKVKVISKNGKVKGKGNSKNGKGKGKWNPKMEKEKENG